MDETQWRLLSAMARRFYLEDASKTELAEEFSMSRFRVARLLKQARDDGVVRIEIHEQNDDRTSLAQDLADHLALRECVVVRAEDEEEPNRRRLAKAAAAFVKQHVRAGDLVGFSWGRTLVAIGEELADLPPCTIIQLTGTVGDDFTQSPIEVIRRIAGRSSVQSVAVYSPLFAASAESAASFRSDPAVQRAQARYADLDLAVLSVGSWDPPITQLASLVSEEDRAELTRQQALAEMAGISIRPDGSIVHAGLDDRRISVSADELARTPRVLAVAGSVDKAAAIAAVARSGLITSLVTDDRAAVALRRLPRVDAPVLERHYPL